MQNPSYAVTNSINLKQSSNDDCHNITNTIKLPFFFVHLAGITQIQQLNKI